jgi:hypothetical protein
MATKRVEVYEYGLDAIYKPVIKLSRYRPERAHGDPVG